MFLLFFVEYFNSSLFFFIFNFAFIKLFVLLIHFKTFSALFIFLYSTYPFEFSSNTKFSISPNLQKKVSNIVFVK